MKILFISYNGALEPLIKSQAIPYLDGLSRKGVKCVLLTFEKRLIDKKHFKEATKNLKIELKNKNIEWYYLKYHKRPTLPATFSDLLVGFIVSSWIIIYKRIDIVHARACIAGAIGYAAARITSRKFLLDERGLMAEEYADGNMWKRGGFLYSATLFVEKRLLRKSDAVIVLTENIRNFLLSTSYLYPVSQSKKREIAVIPCCVDLRLFNIRCVPDRLFIQNNRMEGKFVILYSGSLGTWYLLKEMIDFFQCAKEIIKNAHFLFLTHYDHSHILNLWRKNDLSIDDLTIKSTSYNDISKLMRIADCGIFFIKPSLSKRSSCPIKFAEYLACGLPVVLNLNVGDTDKILERNKVGVVIKVFNREEYVICARDLQEMMKSRDSLINRCYNTAKSLFSLDFGVEKYYQVYKQLQGIR